MSAVEGFRVLLTIVPPKPQADGDHARQMLVNAGLPVFRSEIRRTVAFQRAALDGTTVEVVRNSDTSAIAWLDYERTGKEIEEIYAKATFAKA